MFLCFTVVYCGELPDSGNVSVWSMATDSSFTTASVLPQCATNLDAVVTVVTTLAACVMPVFMTTVAAAITTASLSVTDDLSTSSNTTLPQLV